MHAKIWPNEFEIKQIIIESKTAKLSIIAKSRENKKDILDYFILIEEQDGWKVSEGGAMIVLSYLEEAVGK